MGHELTVNGEVVALGDLPAHTTALDWLRSLGATGAKEGCAEGECGACSVLVARPGVETPTEWIPINACLVPAASQVRPAGPTIVARVRAVLYSSYTGDKDSSQERLSA